MATITDTATPIGAGMAVIAHMADTTGGTGDMEATVMNTVGTGETTGRYYCKRKPVQI